MLDWVNALHSGCRRKSTIEVEEDDTYTLRWQNVRSIERA